MFSGDLLFAGSIGRTDLPGRRLSDHPAQLGQCVPAAAGRHDGAARPRTTHDDRPRTRHQSLPCRGSRRSHGSDTRDCDELSFQAPKGVPRLSPPRSATCRSPPATAFAAAAATPATATSRRPVFEDTELFARGVGESTDVVTQGDVHLRRPGRPLDHAAARGHRAACCAPSLEHGLHNGQLPVKLWYSGPGVPLRAPAGGPLPPLLPGRRRGASAPRTRRSTPRLIVAGRGRLPRARPDPGPAAAQLARATGSAAPSTARRCRTSCAGSTSTRPPGRGSRSTRCGCSTTSGPRCGRSSTDAPLVVDYLCDGVQGPPRRRSASCSPTSASPWEDDAAAGPRPRLLHAHHLRVRPRRARRAVRHRRRRPLRRAVRGRSAARRCPASAGRSASTARCSRWRPRASPRTPARQGRGVRGAARRGGGHGTSSSSSPSCAGPGVAADMAFGGKGLKGAMKSRRPLRGASTP